MSDTLWRTVVFTAIGLPMIIAGLVLIFTDTGPVSLRIALISLGAVLVVAASYRRVERR
ncbi:MAG TPA: hypothetical protein VFT31_04455 [Kribbella sp.]|nr:hypothetical protein [Kribbella sp.]